MWIQKWQNSSGGFTWVEGDVHSFKFFISLLFSDLQKLWLLETAPPDPAAPFHTITIIYIIHYDE